MQISTDFQDEIKQHETDVSIVATTLFILFFVLLISDVRPLTALITICIVCAQTFIGLTITGYQFDAKIRIHASNLFIGFFYGSVIHVIADQTLRTTGYRILVLPLLTVMAIIYKFKELAVIVRQQNFKKFVKFSIGQVNAQFIMLLLVLTPLCQVWSWSRNSVAVLIIAFLIHSRSIKWVKNKILFLPTLLVVVIASRIRPSYWWLPGWGIDENAIYARAIYNWGPKGDVLLAGIQLKYQWFGYSWMGLMSHVTSAKDFEFVSRTAYVICVVAVVLALYAISYEITQNQRKSIVTSFIVVTFGTAISYPVSYTVLSINYQPFAVVSIFCWILVLLKWMKNPTKLCSIELSIVGVICVSAKSVHIVPIVGITVLIACFAFLKKDRRKILGACLTVGISFLYTQLYFPSQSGTGLKPMFADFTRQFGVAPEVSSMKSRIMMVIIVMAALSTATALIMSMPTKYKVLRDLRTPLCIYFCVAVLFAVSLQRVSSTELHFLQIFVLISLVLFASSLSTFFEKMVFRRILEVALTVGLFFSLLLMYYSKSYIVNDESYVVLLIKVNFLLAIFLIAFRIIGIIIGVRSQGSGNQIQNLFVGSLILVCCINFIFVASTRDIRPINKVAATYQLGQQPMQEIANWINENTELDSIIASNLFFGEGGADNCDHLESYLMDSIANDAAKTNYYTPVALIHRRFLAAGVLYAAITFDGSVLSRVQASLRPACFPDGISRMELEQFGVDFYIAHRVTMPYSKFWSELGTVVFENSSYAVIMIR